MDKGTKEVMPLQASYPYQAPLCNTAAEGSVWTKNRQLFLTDSKREKEVTLREDSSLKIYVGKESISVDRQTYWEVR